MPRIEYVLERFKSYESWNLCDASDGVYVFCPAWSSNRILFRLGWVASLIALFVAFVLVYQHYPLDGLQTMTVEDFGSLLQQYQANEIELTATACSTGIVGEINHDEIFWIPLDYNGSRWIPQDLPDSAYAETCFPPLLVHYGRMRFLFGITVLVTLLYGGMNYIFARLKWSSIPPVTLRENGDTFSLTAQGLTLDNLTYDDLDARFNLKTDSISMRRVSVAMSILLLIGSLLSWFVAYLF